MSEWDAETGEFFNNDDEQAATLASVPETSLGTIEVPEGGGALAMMCRAAQGLVRDQKKMIARARQIGGLLGKKGFYRFPAGGKTIQGESVHLAQALAQEWGGIVYQTRILHAESIAGGSQRVHLRSSVGDLRSLVYAEIDQVINTAPAPGKFAKDHDQRERWNGMQVQNATSKVVRNAILDVLPKWYTQPGYEAAQAAADAVALGKNQDGSPRTLAQARKAASDALVEKKCSLAELETFLEQPFDMWAVPQIAMLRELFADLKSGKVSIEAWRAAVLASKAEDQPAAPRKSALGLGSGNGNPLEAVAAAAAAAAKREPAAKGKASKGAAQQSLTGDSEPPDDVDLVGSRQPGEEG